MPTRRQVLAGSVIAGAGWMTPMILTAKPSGAATLSSGPGELNGQSNPETPAAKTGPPLAFTGDNSEQDALIAAGLIGAGWIATRWAARGEPT